MSVSSTFLEMSTRRAPVLKPQRTQDKSNIMRHIAKKGLSGVPYTPMGVRSILLSSKTARGDDHFQILNTYVRSRAEMFPRNALFQQYGALSHTTFEARPILNNLFLISGTGDMVEGNGSLDLLASLNFLLQVFVTENVFETPFSNITQLKQILTTEHQQSYQEMLKNV